jgi:inosose dehydratase
MLDPKRIGHTGITWTTQPVEQKVADAASVGFSAFETFGHVIEGYPGGAQAFRDMVLSHGIVYSASYAGLPYINPAKAKEDIEQAVAWAHLTKEAGGDTLMVSCSGSERDSYTTEEYKGLADTLNTIGRRVTDELGLNVALHPHTGTPIETPEQIAEVVEQLDPRYIGFGPDTGQIAQAGGDAVEVIGRYRNLVRHVHVKDYGGKPVVRHTDGTRDDPTGYSGYVPVGTGVIDFASLFRGLKEVGFKGWLNVELDGTTQEPRPPKEAAKMSYEGITAAIAAANRD